MSGTIRQPIPSEYDGALLHEPSLFEIGFYIGLGFFCAWLVFAIAFFMVFVVLLGMTF